VHQSLGGGGGYGLVLTAVLMLPRTTSDSRRRVSAFKESVFFMNDPFLEEILP
jgi:hypothetical protein